MDLVKVKRHYQITLPNTFRKKFKIAEGDFIEVEDKQSAKGMGVRPTHFTHPNIHANFVNFGTNHNQT